jgi:hypothetical protein
VVFPRGRLTSLFRTRPGGTLAEENVVSVGFWSPKMIIVLAQFLQQQTFWNPRRRCPRVSATAPTTGPENVLLFGMKHSDVWGPCRQSSRSLYSASAIDSSRMPVQQHLTGNLDHSSLSWSASDLQQSILVEIFVRYRFSDIEVSPLREFVPAR